MSKFLMMFDEFGPGMGLPSIRTAISSDEYNGKDKIIRYLKNGKRTFASTRIPRDVLSHKKINIEECGMTDGEYSWISTLPYYVEEYNLHLPKEFTEKVLRNS